MRRSAFGGLVCLACWACDGDGDSSGLSAHGGAGADGETGGTGGAGGATEGGSGGAAGGSGGATGGSDPGAPLVSGVSGPLDDGESVTVSGSGFGSHDLNVEWLGGPTGVIESGGQSHGDGTPFVSSTQRPGWSEVVYPARFDNSRAYSHSWALLCDKEVDDDGRFGLAYDWGSEITAAYVTYLTYFDNGSSASGQWKMYRMMPQAGVEDSQTPQWIMFNKRDFGGGSNAAFRPQTAGEQQTWLSDGDLPNDDEWCRMEIALQASSSNGAQDARGVVHTHRPGVSINRVYQEDAALSYGSSDSAAWRFHVFQNYQGNGYVDSKVWMDDIYISDTLARVEIGDQQSWADCTHREIQLPTAWTPSSITISVNRGRLGAAEPVYLFVVNAAGEASPGLEI